MNGRMNPLSIIRFLLARKKIDAVRLMMAGIEEE